MRFAEEFYTLKKGQRTRSIDLVALIADYFGVTLDSFISEYSTDIPNK